MMKRLMLINVVIVLSALAGNSSGIYVEEQHRLRRHLLDSNVTCTLPPQPKYGRWRLISGEAQEGEEISSNTVLEFNCRKGYRLSPKNSYVICGKNGNLLNIPKCIKLCPPLYSTPTTILKCLDANGDEVGCHEATHDTYLTYTCAPFFESPLGYRTSFCSDGEWNTAGSPVCQPVCGKKVPDDAKPLLFGGNLEKVIEYPWVAVIYKKEYNRYINICGGTVISQRLVLTAAHCVTNSYGDALSNDTFTVAAGKLFNKFNDSRDINAQYLEVVTVIVHPNYRGESRRFLADLALLVTKNFFTLNNFVQPICFGDLKNINLQVGAVGIIPGFGVAEGDDPSNTLRTLEIPFKSESACAAELPSDWGDRYNVIDKLCAGFYNQSRSICSGDSGNGLYFKNPENNRYYVHGIASLGHSVQGRCNTQQNSLYTKVAFHYDFIDRQLIKYYIKNCTLPPHPENGNWTTENEDLQPGDTVHSSTILRIKCEDGYMLSSESAYLTCESTFVMPTCQRRCPKPEIPRNIETSCRNKEGETIYCTEATDHTVLTFKCFSGTVPSGNKNTRTCLNGTWDSPIVCEWKTIETTFSEEDDFTRIVCVYNAKQYDNGVKPEDFNASLCTHVVYASVELSHDGVLQIPRNNASIVSVANMKKKNTQLKVLFRVYGTGGTNDEYPSMSADAAKRTTFISEVTNFLRKYDFDGLDVHWDVPLKTGPYITLLIELRDAFNDHPGWILTTTIYYTYTYLGYSPPYLFDTVHWVNIECYDLYTEWSHYTGQNAALYSSSIERDYERDNFNLESCVGNWKPYSFKKDILSVGVAFFGRYFTLKSERKHGLHAPVTGSTNSSHTGLVSYSEICRNYQNWTRVWDDEQKNPYKYYKNKWVGYDDAQSIELKAAYIAKHNHFGITINSIDQDDVFGKCGPRQNLLKRIHIGLGNTIDIENVPKSS